MEPIMTSPLTIPNLQIEDLSTAGGQHGYSQATGSDTPLLQTTDVPRLIRILLVDDQPLVRQGLRMRLALEPDIEIIGEAEDGTSALESADRLRPDLVVMDYEMPVMDGITATAALHQFEQPPVVIILSIHSSAFLRARALSAGAAAYIEKRDGVNALLEAVRSVFSSRQE